MKTKNNKAFTVVELITTIAVIAILVSVLLPSVYQVRKMAKNTMQKAQLASLEAGLTIYKNDFGDYPASRGYNESGIASYTGAQTMTEALLGYDLLGVHPDTRFTAAGTDINGDDLYPANPDEANLKSRKGPYIKREEISAFKAEDVFGGSVSSNLEGERYVICDVFKAVTRNITIYGGEEKAFKVGTPVLYYKANTSATDIDEMTETDKRIYNEDDNSAIVAQGTVKDGDSHVDFAGDEEFRTYITDPIASITKARPVRADSFLLISAGADGEYGTGDDICNFEPNFE